MKIHGVLAAAVMFTASCGGGGGGAGPVEPALPAPPAPSIELVAGIPPNGTPGASGDVDGPASVARFGSVGDIAIDASGTIYVLDSANRKVRKITPDRMVTTVATIGTSPQTLLNGLAIDGAGNAFVTRIESCAPPLSGCMYRSEIDRIDPAGHVTPVDVKSSSDGGSLRLAWLGAIARAPNGDLYFDEQLTEVLRSPPFVRKLTPGGDITMFDRKGVSTLAFGASGSLYFSDSVYVGILPVGDPAHTFTGPFSAAIGIAPDSTGAVYVSDIRDHIISKVTPGSSIVIAGTKGVSGYVVPTLPGVLNSPGRMALHGRDLYFGMGAAIMVIRNVP